MEVLKIEYPISKTTYVNIDKISGGLAITKNITQFLKNVVVRRKNIKQSLQFSNKSKNGAKYYY